MAKHDMHILESQGKERSRYWVWVKGWGGFINLCAINKGAELWTKVPTHNSAIQFSRSVTSDSLWPHGLQHSRLPIHHQLLKLAQTHVHRVDDAIRPSHPLSSPSPSAFNLSQLQGLFKWVSSSHQVAKVL